MSPPFKKILLVGAGNMGRALLHGWLKHGRDPQSISVLDPNLKQGDLPAGVRLVTDDALEKNYGACVLAIKPQIAEEVVRGLGQRLNETTIMLSIMAGVSIARIREWLGGDFNCARAMPNLPAVVGQGASGVFADAEACEVGVELLEVVGVVVTVESEDQLDVVTALSGSGPAYVFRIVEVMAEAGCDMGLSEDEANRLARQTLIGAAAMLKTYDDQSPTEFRAQVTSKGGTTEAALEVLEKRLPDVMREAMQAAYDRAQELKQGS